jgi:hypothetical protein
MRSLYKRLFVCVYERVHHCDVRQSAMPNDEHLSNESVCRVKSHVQRLVDVSNTIEHVVSLISTEFIYVLVLVNDVQSLGKVRCVHIDQPE